MLRHSLVLSIGFVVLLLGSIPFYAMVISTAFGWIHDADPVGLMLLHFAALIIGIPVIAIGIVATLAESDHPR